LNVTGRAGRGLQGSQRGSHYRAPEFVLALPSGGTVSEQVQRRARDMTTRELTVELGDQPGRLMKEEIALAKAELFASGRQSVLGGGMLGAAALAARLAETARPHTLIRRTAAQAGTRVRHAARQAVSEPAARLRLAAAAGAAAGLILAAVAVTWQHRRRS